MTDDEGGVDAGRLKDPVIRALAEQDPLEQYATTAPRLAIASLMWDCENQLPEVREQGYLDPARYPDWDPIPSLCLRVARYTAGHDARPECRKTRRYAGHPTSPEGRAWFRSMRWHPFLRKLDDLAVRVGMEEVRHRARALYGELADNRIGFASLLVPNGLIKALDPGSTRSAHRPRKTTADKADRWEAACRALDLSQRLDGRWFPRSLLASHTLDHKRIGNPRQEWDGALRDELTRRGIKSRRQESKRRVWELCVNRQRSRRTK